MALTSPVRLGKHRHQSESKLVSTVYGSLLCDYSPPGLFAPLPTMPMAGSQGPKCCRYPHHTTITFKASHRQMRQLVKTDLPIPRKGEVLQFPEPRCSAPSGIASQHHGNWLPEPLAWEKQSDKVRC